MSKARYMPATATGVTLMIVLVVNTLIFGVPVILFCLLKAFARLLRVSAIERKFSTGVMWSALTWMRVNLWFVKAFIDIDWDIDIQAELNNQNSYLITSNHQSWVDIMALYETMINQTSVPAVLY